MVRIKLTQGKISLVDPEFSHLSNWKWCAHKVGKTFYAVRNVVKEDGTRELVQMHHAIIGQPLDRSLVVDHRNGDGLMNIRKNIHHVTKRENSSNKIIRRNGRTSSKYVGVHWRNSCKKWNANIRINGKIKFIGSYTNEKKASEAYKRELSKI